MPRDPKQRNSQGVKIIKSTVTTGGSIVGGDIRGNLTSGNAIVANNIPRDEIDRLFLPLSRVIAACPMDTQDQAKQQFESLKAEVAKGKRADDTLMAELLHGLVRLVPNAVTALTTLFAMPILKDIAGPVTQFLLQKL